MKPRNPFLREIYEAMRKKGYRSREITGSFHGPKFHSKLPYTKEHVHSLVSMYEKIILLRRDRGYIGTYHYLGEAYFWAYKYRFVMRGDICHQGDDSWQGNILDARRRIHDQFIKEKLSLDGETDRHDQIVNSVFNTNYSQADWN